MTVRNKWLQYLTALSLSLPALAHASQPSQPSVKPVTISAAAAAKLRGYADAARSVIPDAKPQPWGRVTWIQEGWANWARAAAAQASAAAPLEQVPSLAALLDDVKGNG
jgi:hypothetical protein